MNASPDVSKILSDICTYNDHLPTGSRLSMLLSYWVNHKMFNRLNNLCLRKSVNMSIYVDDLTFSGMLVNNSFFRDVKKIISKAGFSLHENKTRLYSADKAKLITGVVLLPTGEIKVRNKHHKSIYTLFNKIKNIDNDEQLHKYQKKLAGKLNAAGQIDSKFKKIAKIFNLYDRL